MLYSLNTQGVVKPQNSTMQDRTWSVENAIFLRNQNIAVMEYVKEVMFCLVFMYDWII
jgi:hypothetical protein